MTTRAAPADAPDAASTLPQDVARATLVSLPFLFPLAAGPSANVWQLLASWACLAAMCLAGGLALPSRAVAVWLGVSAAALFLIRGTDAGLWVPALVAIAAIGLASCVGAALARADARAQASLAWGLLAAGCISAVLGLLQYYALAAPLVPWTTAPELGQAYGNLRQRNQFATLISMALAAALFLYGARGATARRGLLGAMALLAVAAAASTSRTGLMQWVGILAVAAFLARRERRHGAAGAMHWLLPAPWLLLALIALYFAAGWVLPYLAGGNVEDMLRRLREGAPAGHSRVLLWNNVLALIGQHPWTGWGWGELSYAHLMHLYGGPRFVEILDNAHNLPLHLAVELGVPVALAVCGGFVVLLLAAQPWRERDPLRLMAWAVLGAIVLHSLLEYPLWYGPFQLVFGLCLGLLWPGRAGAMRPLATSLAALALTGAVGYAAWDYTRISQIFLVRAQRLPSLRDDTIAKLQSSWLFANQVRFAELTLTPVTRDNAQAMHDLAQQVLHFSPEPRVIAKLIDACVLLGREDEALPLMARFKIAFPAEYAQWTAGLPVDGPPKGQ